MSRKKDWMEPEERGQETEIGRGEPLETQRDETPRTRADAADDMPAKKTAAKKTTTAKKTTKKAKAEETK